MARDRSLERSLSHTIITPHPLRPLAAEKRIRLLQPRTINKAAATESDSAWNRHVSQHRLSKETLVAKGWKPEQRAGLFLRIEHLPRVDTDALLHDGDAIALFGEA